MRLSLSLPVVAAASLAFFMLAMQAATARDQGLRAILDRENCVVDRITTTRLSPELIAYEVVCRQSARVLYVTCLNDECQKQNPPHRDDELQNY